VFDAIVTHISSFLAIHSFVSMETNAELHTLYVCQARDDFAVRLPKFDFIHRPADKMFFPSRQACISA
jgi:hypothetical protein